MIILLSSFSSIFAVWVLLKYFIRPLLIRYYYSYYKNVVMSERFVPFVGDRYLVKQDNKYRLWHNMETALKNPN